MDLVSYTEEDNQSPFIHKLDKDQDMAFITAVNINKDCETIFDIEK